MSDDDRITFSEWVKTYGGAEFLTVGERIRGWRLYRGLGIDMLALAAGIRMDTLMRIEHDDRKASEEVLTKIATALRLEPWEMLSALPPES